MLKLEAITKDCQIAGMVPNQIVRIVTVEPAGSDALTVYYKTPDGNLGERMLFRSDQASLSLAEKGRAWSFDADGNSFKLALEALRIRLAHLFDPMMAVHTSNVEPLPHQISAVYEAMLPRQPLRFVLADDPGAGKTIMAGLFIRELIMRADARRIMIVSPGSLTEQWQDELLEKFGVEFEIFSKDKKEQCASGNFFNEATFLIVRLDQLSRNDDYQELLKNSEWDLVVVDEAHKLSASYFGNKVNKTKRFLLGELLGKIARHFLLMTATPHNGKEEDFQLWLSLLDGDRFYGKFRDGAHKVDISDIMRRLVKEELLKFDGTRLFPERRAYTANYELSDKEAALYDAVTHYVREEMNRADTLEGNRKGTVGFALTMLQRRLASSPEAIYQSLKRRQKRLDAKLEELRLLARGNTCSETLTSDGNAELYKTDNHDDIEEDMTGEEYENYVDTVVYQATASATIQELSAEIEILKNLTSQAYDVVQSGSDRKWDELSTILQDNPEMRTSAGSRRKLIIFTEHKDTLNYLRDRIGRMLGNPEAVVEIHGSVHRDMRRKVQEEFRNNPDVLIMLATDAAGEGVNLQNANLMVNYDLPWNPNRLEQRFGRIHRIGQTEVCHLWNLVAMKTREGEVFKRLFDKLEVERKALGGRVYDILGEAFENVSLKELLIEAIRFGESPEKKAELQRKIEGALDTEHLKDLMRRNALTQENMTLDELYSVKEEMEKAEARKLQPYFIRAFFTECFELLNGELRPRETGRYEVRHVPAHIRERDRVIGETRTPVLKKYERICFEKQHVRTTDGKPMADLIHPAHPLMHAVTDIILSSYRNTLKQGAVFVDPTDDSTEPKLLLVIDHSLRESAGEKQRVVSRRLQFVEVTETGDCIHAGWAPHLDLVPLSEGDKPLVADILKAPWLNEDLEKMALDYASTQMVPQHYQEVKTRLTHQADKTMAAVNDRLVKEINYWSGRAIQLDEDVKAGKQPRLQPENARKRAEELTARLEQRRSEMDQMKSVVSNTPVIVGGACIIPQGLLAERKGESAFAADAAARAIIERIAMQAVMDAETALGHVVKDVSAEKCGWDITAHVPHEDGILRDDRHIEVKGRAKGQSTITVSRNEILCAFNQKEKFVLAIVIVEGEGYEGPFYVRNPFSFEPDAGIASINFSLDELLQRSCTAQKSLSLAK